MEQKRSRREWVKTAAIILLSVLLVLTLFSQTIMNASLPEVSTSAVQAGPITAKVKCTGTVSSIGKTEVKPKATYTVATVKAKEGAEVEAGDVLFIFGAASEELEAAQNELDSLRYSLLRAQNSGGGSTPNYSGVISAQKELDDAYAEWDVLIATISDEDYRSLENDADNTIRAAFAAFEEASTKYASYQKGLEDAVNAAIVDLENAIKNFGPESDEALSAEMLLAERKASRDESTNSEEYRNRQAAEARYDSLVNNYSDLQAAQNRIDAAESSLQNAYNTANSGTPSTAWIDVQEYQSKIAKAEAKVKELSGGEDNALTAPVAGKISSISTSPGSKVTKDDVLCIIEVSDMGYELESSITNDQAKRIKVGDTATVSNYYWGSEIKATVSSIKVDKKNPQTNKSITFTLDGDVSPGSQMTISVGERSANYDVVVPNSAVRTDSNGTFVLMITAKSNALGNRYFAQRMPVEVLASDDNNSAISGGLSNGDFVITTSSEPIKNGSQVRMADNG